LALISFTQIRRDLHGAQEVRRSPQAQGCGFGERTRKSAQRAFLVTSLHEQRSDSLAQRVKALALNAKEQKQEPGFQLPLE
jgi:hypothetical protein